MPIDEYVCPAGHRVEVRVRMDRSDAPTECPCVLAEDATPDDKHGITTICAQPLRRVLSAPAPIFPGAASWRRK